MSDQETSVTEEGKPCKFFFKRPNRGKANIVQKPVAKVAKQSDSDEDSSSDDETKIVTIERKKKKNPLIQSTSSFSGLKRKKVGQDSDPSDSSDDEKRSLVTVSYRSDRRTDRAGPSDMGATATIEIDTPVDQDARAIFEKSRKVNEERKGQEDDKVYRGLNNYTKYIVAKDSAQGSALSSEVAKGPVRAPSNIRSTVRWDYKPDLCKDYKETGYCGFGDSCIFLHDRTDYKSGWQIELEYEKGEYGQDDEDPSKYEIKEEEEIPFKCLICRKSFVNPVVTKCKHYFCEKCALDNYKKSTRCFVCQVQTQGIFNPAVAIIKKLAVKKQKRLEDCPSDEEDQESHNHHHHDHQDEEEQSEESESVHEDQEGEEGPERSRQRKDEIPDVITI